MTVVAVRFFANVDDNTIRSLLTRIDEKMKAGIKDFILLISTQGGWVNSGLTAYNYLKGLPINITTHNIGAIDSIGMALYCVGTKRISSPNARFLIHSVNFTIQGTLQLSEVQLKEKLESLQIDTQNIAKVIASTIGKDIKDVVSYMEKSTILSPEMAKKIGIVTEINEKLFEEGIEVISIN